MTAPPRKADPATSRILVTGASGFLGKHLTRTLAERGWRHILTPTRAECDLRDGVQVARLMADTKPDVVIHLAATVGGIGANRAACWT